MRWLFAPVLVLLLLTSTAMAQQIPEPLIVFVPQGPVDWMNMWTDSAPWQQAAGKVQMIVLTEAFIQQSPISQVQEIVDFAKPRHIKIGLAIDSIQARPGITCGIGEGFSLTGSVAYAANQLLSLNVDVDTVEIDEPLWFGHYTTDPTKCQLAIPDLATRTALIVQEALTVYPHARILETEPLPITTSFPTWRQDMTAFHLGLLQQLGTTVSTVQSDTAWTDPTWEQSFVDMRQYLHQQNLAFGVIYDGNPLSTNNADWVSSTIGNMEAVEGSLHIVPDVVTFQSWNAYPTNNLPETSTSAQTWEIDRYFRPRSSLAAQFVGQGVQGKLITMDGKPIANATINGYKPGVDFTKPLPTIVYQGVVPATAVFALVGIRLNTECNLCNGLDDVLIGAIQYQETQGGTSKFTFQPVNAPGVLDGAIVGTQLVGGTQVARIIAAPGQQVLYNSQEFPVTAGAQYTFTVPAGTVGGRGWTGNVDYLWGDGKGGGSRVTITPGPGKALVSTTTTNPDGTFALSPLPRTVDGPGPVTVEFDGGGGVYRSSVWTPLQ